MKTVKEIAESANVSKTSVYNLIKKHSIPTLKREGKTFLDESSESLVIGYYSTEQHETISDILNNTKLDAFSDSNSDLENEYEDSKLIEYIKVIGILEDERGEKNKIIKELLQSNKILGQALAANKVNETARLMIKDNLYEVSSNTRNSNLRKGFFYRIFKKNSIQGTVK